MGYAIAEACASQGAEVTLVSGPVNIRPVHPAIRVVPVETAAQMYEAATGGFRTADIAILSAAVADFLPESIHTRKMKRTSGEMNLRLKPTRDIAASLGEMKKDTQILVGFALETDNEVANALEKLKKKNLDCIVLNSLNDEGAGFQTDTNRITIIDRNNIIYKFELKSKREVANDIVDKIIELSMKIKGLQDE